jgi:hypothetical protein
MLCFHKVSFCRQERLHWEDKINTCPTDAMCVYVTQFDWLGKGQMTGFYEGGIEPTMPYNVPNFLITWIIRLHAVNVP